jgi:uracil-DNA glycosylase family 4
LPSNSEPARDCALCDRLVAYRSDSRARSPDWHNAPVPSFGPSDARLLIVGLAPGLKGANRTGRPFTGDYAGDLLYETLLEFGLARGTYCADPADGLSLIDCMITNAVRCVPPENKPTPDEISRCRPFLSATIDRLPRLRCVLALGRIAHESTLRALGCKLSAFPFSHGARHEVREHLSLYDSFHCSRYNTNTGRLTPGMFKAVFESIAKELPPA